MSTAFADHMRSAVRLIGALLLLSLSSVTVAQAPPPGTVYAWTANHAAALIWWNFGLVGGGTFSRIDIQHCSVSVAACSDPSASPTLFQGSVRFTGCDGPFGCPATSAYDTQLTASTTYVEKVTLFPSASNTTGQITSVLSAPFTTSAFPAPSIVSVQGTSGTRVLLNTNQPDQYYLGAYIYGCVGAGCTNFTQLDFYPCCVNWEPGLGILPPSTQTFTVPLGGLTPATTYTVYVTASDGPNTSPPSPAFTFVTPPVDTTPPTPPTSLSATVVSSTEIDLSYGGATDDLYMAGYQVQRCAGAGCTNFTVVGGSGLALTYDDTGLTPSTTYQYEVVATDGSNNMSPPSSIVTVTTLPGAPTALSASQITSTQVTLSWTPTGSVSGLAGYLIEQCQGTGCTAFSQVMQVSSPTAQINGLTPRGIYQFRVRSLDPSGNDSGYSNIVTLTLPPIPAPTALAAAALSDSQITLTWSPASGSATTAYLVERCAGSGCTNYVQIGSTPNSPYMDGGLLTQSAYQYRVRATDAAADMSDYVSTGTSTGTLAAPGGLSGAVVSTSQINLNWFASPSTGIASYLIERCSGAGCATFTQVAAVNGTTYSDTGLTSNTSYIYRVRATDPAGAMSPYTPAVAVTTLALAPPTNLTATLIWGSQVRLAWGPSPSSCATGYVVERCNGTGCNGFLSLASVMSISYADGGAGGPGTYSYRVHATDAAGDVSVASNVVSVTTSSGSGTGGSGSGTGGSGGGSGGGSSGGGTGPGGGGSNSGSTSTYVYDSNGHLIKVTTNGVTTTYTYDAAGHVVSIQNGN